MEQIVEFIANLFVEDGVIIEDVPTFEKFTFTTWEDLIERVEKYYDGADPVGKSHVREGVVVRIDNRPSFTAYKHKNFSFKCLSGIAIDSLTDEQIQAIIQAHKISVKELSDWYFTEVED